MGPCHVFDANGNFIDKAISCHVSAGEVVSVFMDANGMCERGLDGKPAAILTVHPAPLIVRQIKEPVLP